MTDALPHTAGIDRLAEPPIAEIEARVHGGRGQTLADSETLPPEAYTSQAFFEREREMIFRRGWMALGHVAQIPEVGDYFTIDLLGEPMVVVRAADRIRVLSRVCLHRWAPVVSGKGNAKMFSCPFHRWAYDLTGQLRSAPFMDQAAGFDPKACKLPEFRAEVVLGTIYVNLSGDAEPLAPRMDGLAREYSNIPLDDLVIGFSVEFPCPFNWKIAVETFMECYHHIGAHSKTLQPHSPGGDSYGVFKEDPEQGWIVARHPLRADLGHEHALTPGLPVFEDWTEEQIRIGSLYHVFPNHLVGTSANAMRWTAVLPISATESWWIRHYLVHRDALKDPGFAELMARLKTSGDVIAKEDLDVNTLQQRGAASRLARPGRLSHLELPVWQLADWVRDGIGGGRF
ncbi:aromatic ring-hydroxylating oxygenase subunit alpha [Frigidibacter sp. MR17.24]|uniref:aromatic ring-hydroxylating oxygenase subunit alpha n=1 Tax=Frigidibacter sp. MR17.24 TaxID=3127345 RepID=UPI003012B6B0